MSSTTPHLKVTVAITTNHTEIILYSCKIKKEDICTFCVWGGDERTCTIQCGQSTNLSQTLIAPTHYNHDFQ